EVLKPSDVPALSRGLVREGDFSDLPLLHWSNLPTQCGGVCRIFRCVQVELVAPLELEFTSFGCSSIIVGVTQRKGVGPSGKWDHPTLVWRSVQRSLES